MPGLVQYIYSFLDKRAYATPVESPHRLKHKIPQSQRRKKKETMKTEWDENSRAKERDEFLPSNPLRARVVPWYIWWKKTFGELKRFTIQEIPFNNRLKTFWLWPAIYPRREDICQSAPWSSLLWLSQTGGDPINLTWLELKQFLHTRPFQNHYWIYVELACLQKRRTYLHLLFEFIFHIIGFYDGISNGKIYWSIRKDSIGLPLFLPTKIFPSTRNFALE